MTIPTNLTQAAAPYGGQPVALYAGQEGAQLAAKAPASRLLVGAAARTASLTVSDIVNQCFKGVYLSFSVTVNPGGAQTLEFIADGKDDISATYYRILDVPASATPGGVFLIYPGIAAGPVGDVLATSGLILPQTWRVRVVHSGAGAWTYTLNMTVLP